MANKQTKNEKDFKIVGGQTVPGKEGELTMPPHAAKDITSKYIFSLINGGFNFDISLNQNTQELVDKVNAKYNTKSNTAKKSKTADMEIDN